ncbi:MAG: exodeoxyribonuclease VII large subunit [Candidatus Portnoybacteria bacterium]|nr:exodeoxyribonuclease VII large subunit [Candidatus Portnoybacteria bacterium]
MSQDILQKLKGWREVAARNEGAPLFRVFPNSVLEEIAETLPKNKEELLAIKGIKERKFEKYGEDILVIVNENPPLTVSGYLDLLNLNLQKQGARVKGEISSLDIRGGYLFFTLKDKNDGSALSCFMWASDYQMCGIAFEEGMEIIVEGYPKVYKPRGSLSFQVLSAELVGEGALKKAYEELKKKLEGEGLFAPERKKPISEFPQRIGLITSKTGAVIHDFLNNLGRRGYKISFFNSTVEGQAAVRDLISAVDYFKDKKLDVLVIIRGGGSLESLQAFNNENLVRKIADFGVPVICGIGHDKDVPLASLAADLMTSTPTAVAVALNKSWENALANVKIFERDLIYKYQEVFNQEQRLLENLIRGLKQHSEFVFKRFELIKNRFKDKITELGYSLKNISAKLDNAEKRLESVDPKRQLKLGYSIASAGGKILRSVRQVEPGQGVDIRVADGKIKTRVEETNYGKK